jgi:TolB protein
VFLLSVLACNYSDVTSPSAGGGQVTAATSSLVLSGLIAFVSNRAGNDEIYVIKADGTGLTRLTRNPAHDEGPAWSPGGKKLAFMSDRAGNAEIHVMNADGTGVTRLTNNPASDGGPAWSPDGSKIAFMSNRLATHSEIYAMNANARA